MIPGYVGDDTESAPLISTASVSHQSSKKKGALGLFRIKDKESGISPQKAPGFQAQPHIQAPQPPQIPSISLQPPPQPRQTVEQNEMDLYYGPLLQELGINMHIVLRKFISIFPYVPVPDDVAQSGDMVIGIAILLLSTLVSLLVKSTGTNLGFLFGAFVYGSILLTFLLSMLRQTATRIDLYVVMSALSYGLIPLLIPMFVCSFLSVDTFKRFQRTVVLGYLISAVLSSLISTKLLNAAVRLENVRTLIAIPAFLITMCYVPVQISK